MNNLRSFRKISDKNLAVQLVDFLKENNINSSLTELTTSLDSTFGDSELNKLWEIKLNYPDFEQANNLLEQQAEESLNNVEEDHYLFEFTDEKLYDILSKPDEWNEFDFKLAQKILKERGNDISQDQIESYKSDRIEELSESEVNHPGWIIAGYIFAALGGLWGVAIGWHLWKGKKTLPNGERILRYSSTDRNEGKTIFILGIIVLSIAIPIRVYY